MAQVEVVGKGETKNGNFWFRLQEEINGFLVTGFLRSKKEDVLEEGVQDIPSKIYNAIQWQA